MSQLGNLELVETNPLTQFTAAILVNAAAYLDLLLPQAISAGRTSRARLKTLSVISMENVGWEVWLFNKRTSGVEPTPDVSSFAGYWSFAAGDAVQIGATGLYYYYIDGLDVPYETLDLLPDGRPDENDARKYLHMALIARTTQKTASPTGLVKIRFGFEPTLGH